MNQRRLWSVLGIFFVVFSVYCLSGPGRIDSIDGQIRYEIAWNLLHEGRPVVKDKNIRGMTLQVENGSYYSLYGPAASVSSLPFLVLAKLFHDPKQELSRFLFTFTTPVYGALLAVVLFLFLLALGVAQGPAFLWTMASALGTLVWPLSTSVLDQVQHAFWLLLAAYWGYLSAQRNSYRWAALAGLAAGVMCLYHEYYAILFPFLAVVTFAHDRTRSSVIASLQRYMLLGAMSAVGLGLCVLYNWTRFDFLLRAFSSKEYKSGIEHPDAVGNLWNGFSSLLWSPGKSIFLYSPILILCILGLRHLKRQAPWVFWALLSVSGLHLFIISSVTLFAGDWCWGPRYLVILLPLWALALPFVHTTGSKLLTTFKYTIVIAGVVVQLLALSVVHQRFFFDLSLEQFFWAKQPRFYFKHSALFSRLNEVNDVWIQALPSNVRAFAPTPRQTKTYATFGPPSRIPGKYFLTIFEVFNLPRPWPLWTQMYTRGPPPLPFSTLYPLFALLGFFGFGCWCLSKASLPMPEEK